MNPNIIFVRFMDSGDDTCHRLPALLVSEHLALCYMDEGLELYFVRHSPELDGYTPVYCSNQILHVGSNWEAALHDSRTMTYLEFMGKYLHPELIDYLKEQAPSDLRIAFRDKLPKNFIAFRCPGRFRAFNQRVRPIGGSRLKTGGFHACNPT